MAKKLTKALRGKRRWIGCKTSEFKTRVELEKYLSRFPVKLYDFEDNKFILMVRLEDYYSVKEEIQNDVIKTVTSSGKIRLVRDRMGLSRKPRKR